MKVVMVSGESRPFCKTGGLADVVYSLSKELAKMGHEVSIIIPFYQIIKNKNINTKKVDEFDVQLNWRHQQAEVFLTKEDGINYYLISNYQHFERMNLYGDFDDGERFAFFTQAARNLIVRLKQIPDVIHVHDWHVGMLPCLFREDQRLAKRFNKTKFVLTIHNPAFQGLLPDTCLFDLYNLPYDLYSSGKLRLKEQFSTLKAGIVYADKITTVSPSHHNELLTPDQSMDLDGSLRLREWDFCGFLNGIDYIEFNPEDDTHIAKVFSLENIAKNKKANKKALLKEFGLTDYGKPLFSVVSRITWQKGFDLILYASEELAKQGCNIIVLGSGEYEFEQRLEDLRRRFPDNVGIYIGYSDPLAHRVYASSDFFMMPSLFEPCGLGQMIAQRYGTLPIVRMTGGLRDSVICYDGNNVDSANGFGFETFSCYEMNRTCLYALEIWKDQKTMQKLIKNAFLTDNSWEKSAVQYEGLYKSLKK